MTALGKDIGSQLLPVTNMTAALAGATVNAGRALDLLSLATRPQSVCGVIGIRANLDSADTAIVDNIKLVSDTSSDFATAVATRVTASDITLTGTAADTDYWAAAKMTFDLTQLPETHRYIRLSARTTLSDTTNTSGQVFGLLVFGGLNDLPAA